MVHFIYISIIVLLIGVIIALFLLFHIQRQKADFMENGWIQCDKAFDRLFSDHLNLMSVLRGKPGKENTEEDPGPDQQHISNVLDAVFKSWGFYQK